MIKATIRNEWYNDEILEIKIEESGAFQYGNGKFMVVKDNGVNRTWWYDIRYDKRYKGNDLEFVKEFLEEDYLGSGWSVAEVVEA